MTVIPEGVADCRYPTEAVAALNARASTVKLFPASMFTPANVADSLHG